MNSSNPDSPARGPGVAVGLVGASLACAVLLYANVPDFSAISFWMWPYQPAPGSNLALALLFVAAPATLISIFAVRCLQRGRVALGMAIFIAASVATSNAALPIIVGEWRAVAKSFGDSGHADLSIRATRVDASQIVHEYEKLVESRALGRYGVTRGPGVVLVYHALGRASQQRWIRRLVEPLASLHDFSGTPYAPRPLFATLIWIVFSLLPWLTVLPLYWMSTAVLGKSAGAWGPAVFLSIPASSMAILHSDGAIIMPMFTLVAALAINAQVAGRWSYALLAGALCGLGSWFAPVLLASLAVAIAPGGVAILRSLAVSDSDPHARAGVCRSALIGLGASLTGLVVALALLRVGFGYDLFERLAVATAYHAAWRPGLDPSVWFFASLLEFALYLGPVILFAATWRAAREATRPSELLASPLPTLAIFALLAALALQHHQPETIRLWLFMTPLFAWAALQGLEAVAAGEDAARERILPVAIGCGYFMLVVLNATRPFYWK